MNEELNKIKIAIIDDLEEEAVRSKNIIHLGAANFGYSIDPLIIKLNRDDEDDDNKNIGEIIEDLRGHFNEVNLGILIIDFRLSTDIARYGSSLALRLREGEEGINDSFLNKLAIIGISSTQPTDEGRTQLREIEFIELFNRQDLQDTSVIEALFKIAEGYSVVIKTISDQLDRGLLSRILATGEISNLLWNAIPEDFKRKWDTDTPHLFSRWIWKELLHTPGFLIDKFYASTLLGITENALDTVLDSINSAKYTGIFSLESKPLWWKEKLINKVTKIVESEKLMPIWKRGRKLNSEFSNEHFARCAITNEVDVKLIPAYRGDDSKELVPITFSLTKEKSNESVSVGFDPIRIWNGES